MAIVSRALLKSFFKKGARPSQDQFESLIDSFVHVAEDNYKLGLHPFSTETVYPAGATVLYNGELYKAIRQTGSGMFDASEWIKLGSKERKEAVESKVIKAETGKKAVAAESVPVISKVAAGQGLQWQKANVEIKEGVEKKTALYRIPGRVIVLGTFIRLPEYALKQKNCSLAVGTDQNPEQFLPFCKLKPSSEGDSVIEMGCFSMAGWEEEVAVYLSLKITGAGKLSLGKVEVYTLFTGIVK